MYVCDNCGKSYTREHNLKRHVRESCKGADGPTPKKLRTEKGASTSKMDSTPSTSASSNETVVCNCCNKTVTYSARKAHFRTLEHRTNACIDYIPGVQLIQTAFKSRIASYRVSSENRCNDNPTFFEMVKNFVLRLLTDAIRVHRAVKVNMELFARYSLKTQEVVDIKSFNTINKVIDESTDLDSVFRDFVDLMATQMSEFQERDSAGCEFKKSWKGRWFQSGVPNNLFINSTYIDTKGECYEEDGDKYLVYERAEDCFRCLVIHPKHPSVLQYKETFCEPKASLADICSMITGDAPLYSLFRKHPEAKPIPCPFKSAPFTFSYNRMTGDCSNPPSKAESCTDDSRLVLKYQACPDVPSTESNVEELVCLATWKEGSTRYLIGKISQGNRRSTTDEDQYRCFIYQRSSENGKTIYNVAQSGDATCTGLDATSFEGSRTMKLTTVDDQHKRCKFPVWITDHHTWLSLDHHKVYKFSQRNATLKILDDEPPKQNKVHQNFAQPYTYGFAEFGFESQDQRRNSEMRVVCHGILQQQEQKKVQIMAHVTAGCDSGYICMVFYKRDSNVIEIQQTENYVENPDDACANFDPSTTPYTTLITTNLHPKKCPHLGRYTVATLSAQGEKRKRRQQPDDPNGANDPEPDCISHDYEALAVGCSGSHEMEFKSSCSQQAISAYSCHGSWEENGISYVITTPMGRKSTESLRYCFIYTVANQVNSAVIEGNLGKSTGPPVLRLSGVSESCHRSIVPGVTGNWAFNFTSNGTCAESDDTNASQLLLPTIVLVALSLLSVIVLR